MLVRFAGSGLDLTGGPPPASAGTAHKTRLPRICTIGVYRTVPERTWEWVYYSGPTRGVPLDSTGRLPAHSPALWLTSRIDLDCTRPPSGCAHQPTPVSTAATAARGRLARNASCRARTQTSGRWSRGRRHRRWSRRQPGCGCRGGHRLEGAAVAEPSAIWDALQTDATEMS